MLLGLADQLGRDSEIVGAIDDVSDGLNSQPKPNQDSNESYPVPGFLRSWPEKWDFF
jgi:hypothetical protein